VINRLCIGTPIKAILGKHSCIACGNKLQLKSYNRIVEKDSEDAKCYNFDGFGDFKVEWKKFYCPMCGKSLECSTQTSYEKSLKIDKMTYGELIKHFNSTQLSRSWVDSNGLYLDRLPIFDDEILDNVFIYTYFIEHNSKKYPFEVCVAQRRKMRERPLSIKKDKNYSRNLSNLLTILEIK